MGDTPGLVGWCQLLTQRCSPPCVFPMVTPKPKPKLTAVLPFYLLEPCGPQHGQTPVGEGLEGMHPPRQPSEGGGSELSWGSVPPPLGLPGIALGDPFCYLPPPRDMPPCDLVPLPLPRPVTTDQWELGVC